MSDFLVTICVLSIFFIIYLFKSKRDSFENYILVRRVLLVFIGLLFFQLLMLYIFSNKMTKIVSLDAWVYGHSKFYMKFYQESVSEFLGYTFTGGIAATIFFIIPVYYFSKVVVFTRTFLLQLESGGDDKIRTTFFWMIVVACLCLAWIVYPIYYIADWIVYMSVPSKIIEIGWSWTPLIEPPSFNGDGILTYMSLGAFVVFKILQVKFNKACALYLNRMHVDQ